MEEPAVSGANGGRGTDRNDDISPRTLPRTSLTLPDQDRRPSSSPRVQYASPPLSVDTQTVPFPNIDTRHRSMDPHRDRYSVYSPAVLRRRTTRAATFKTFDGADDLELPFHEQPGWQPGAEPGYDPQLPDGGHASMPTLSAPCEITVVNYSLDRISQHHFDNQSFVDYMQQDEEPWVKCRWININGLSWDVIQAVGAKKGLHKLALEDIMNIRNRTKAEWYPNHAFIIMTLQKLVHIVEVDDDSSSTSSDSSRKKRRNFFAGTGVDDIRDPENMAAPTNGTGTAASQVFPDGPILPETSMLRSLQRYHASSNEPRIEFMEAHSSLAPYNLAVSAEQVSIFLTSDNTVISFFETSAPDIERPIVTRLSTPGTILRESCDASLLVQGIIDAIIDLAIPLTAAYTDIIGDLELDVLTSPSIKQSRRLYICISEINKMLRFLMPIDNLVNVLRDHRTLLTQEQAARELTNPASGVIVTPLTHTYLGDVLDHCIIITESMQQLKQSSDNLINLIFNTITANQNESMKQLTIVTIIFLPMTFITGFFGQNFEDFPEIKHGIWYFWACAVPTACATILLLMREMIYNWFVRVIQRKHIVSLRKRKGRQKGGKTPFF